MSVATDPSHTLDIRQDFIKAIQRRFRNLRGLIRQTVGYENDAFGLAETMAEPQERFDFPTDSGKTQAFLTWLRKAIREEILQPVSETDVRFGEHWTAKFIKLAFIRGVNQSTGLLFQQGASVENIPDDEILNRPMFANTLHDLYARTYDNLKDITTDMDEQISEIVTEGFAKGWNPRKMADKLTKEVRNIQHTRAETLARTETINAHASASIANYKRAGVDVVGHAYWSDADDERVCPFCSRLDGMAISLDEAENEAVSWAVEDDWEAQTWRLKPPAHPSGRCILKPAIGADAESLKPLSKRLEENFEGATVA